MSKAQQLRHMLLDSEVTRVAGVQDALSALVAEEIGFHAVWASSFAISATRGLPDMSLLSMTDYLQAASYINDVCEVPVIADCDTGFGDVLNVAYMVQRYQAAGIAGVCIEDKIFPKRNSFQDAGQVLEEPGVFAHKIEVAKKSQHGDDFVLIARTEALIAGEGTDDALKRALQYADAGADAILVHSKSQTPHEVIEFLHRWPHVVPVVVVPTTYYNWHLNEAANAGVAVIIYANQGLRAAVRSMRDTLRQVYEAGSSVSVEPEIASVADIFRLQRLNDWLALES
jgi:phosphoenolpyruvate phosphomutase